MGEALDADAIGDAHAGAEDHMGFDHHVAIHGFRWLVDLSAVQHLNQVCKQLNLNDIVNVNEILAKQGLPVDKKLPQSFQNVVF